MDETAVLIRKAKAMGCSVLRTDRLKAGSLLCSDIRAGHPCRNFDNTFCTGDYSLRSTPHSAVADTPNQLLPPANCPVFTVLGVCGTFLLRQICLRALRTQAGNAIALVTFLVHTFPSFALFCWFEREAFQTTVKIVFLVLNGVYDSQYFLAVPVFFQRHIA